MFSDLPRELQHMIVSKLDIDTRRALGIYTRLKVPHSLQHMLGAVVTRVILCGFNYEAGRVDVYPYSLLHKPGGESFWIMHQIPLPGDECLQTHYASINGSQWLLVGSIPVQKSRLDLQNR